MKVEIKHKLTGEVLFNHTCEGNTIKETLLKAIKENAYLNNTDLSNADLRNADLSNADLEGANLISHEMIDHEATAKLNAMTLEQVEKHFEGAKKIMSIDAVLFNSSNEFKDLSDLDIDFGYTLKSYDCDDIGNPICYSIYQPRTNKIAEIVSCKEGYELIDGKCEKVEGSDNIASIKVNSDNKWLVNREEHQKALDKVAELMDQIEKLNGTIEEHENDVNRWETEKVILENKIENYRIGDPITKPPLGLKPKYINDEERLSEIESAFERYINEDKQIPSIWVEEHLSLITPLKHKKKTANEFETNYQNTISKLKLDNAESNESKLKTKQLIELRQENDLLRSKISFLKTTHKNFIDRF